MLARNRPSYAAAITIADLPPQSEQVYRRLAGLLGHDVGSDQDARHASGSVSGRFSPIVVKRNIGDELALVLEERHRELPGVHVVSQSIREYVDGTLTANVLGYMGAINAKQLEARSKDDAARIQGRRLDRPDEPREALRVGIRGYPGSRSPRSTSRARRAEARRGAPTPGNNLVLTLDFDLQRAIASLSRLRSRPVRYGATPSSSTRRLARCSRSFTCRATTPTSFARGITEEELQTLLNDPRHPLLDGAIGSAYPIGSIFQAITASGALQEGIVKGDQKVDCAGVAGHTEPPRRPDRASRFVGSAASGPQDVVSALANSCRHLLLPRRRRRPGRQDVGSRAQSGLQTYAQQFGSGRRPRSGSTGKVRGSSPRRSGCGESKKKNGTRETATCSRLAMRTSRPRRFSSPTPSPPSPTAALSTSRSSSSRSSTRVGRSSSRSSPRRSAGWVSRLRTSRSFGRGCARRSRRARRGTA